jgi:mono/diheme cytochrome c family protein
MRRRLVIALALVASTVGLVACGSEEISTKVAQDNPQVQSGAKLFAQRCAGCHTLDAAGTQGTTLNFRQRERTDGPNFNVRKELTGNVLYAIRNGGYSGAIMPENIVVGKDAQAVAQFLAKYAGRAAGSKQSSDISPTGNGQSGP